MSDLSSGSRLRPEMQVAEFKGATSGNEIDATKALASLLKPCGAFLYSDVS